MIHIGHQPFDPDAETLVPIDSGLQESAGAFLSFTDQHLAEGDAGMVVDGDVNEFPAGRGAVLALVALSHPVAGDAVPGAAEFAEFLDVHLEELLMRLPRQNKKQREGLSLLVATMLEVRSANLMDLAASDFRRKGSVPA